jgi:peptidylprolyl isomerase
VFFESVMAIENGDKVSVEYEGTFDSGEVFDSTSHGDHNHPLEFVVGQNHVIKGFEEAVVGMNEGDEKEIKINPEEAYGERREEPVREFPRDQIPLEQEPKEGMILGFNAPNGQQFPATIVKVTDDKITFDLNHPLSGRNLNFKVKIAGIEKDVGSSENADNQETIEVPASSVDEGSVEENSEEIEENKKQE